jgi:hypothetical protein
VTGRDLIAVALWIAAGIVVAMLVWNKRCSRVQLFVCALPFLAAACGDRKREIAEQIRRAAEARWNGPCADTATLLATTTGSPSDMTCPNKRHRMRVQLTSAPSNEEFGALVFCECEREPTP